MGWVVAANEVGAYEGKPSDEQLQLREVFRCWGVCTGPKKSAEGTLNGRAWVLSNLEQRGLPGARASFEEHSLGPVWSSMRSTSEITCEPRDLSLVGQRMHSVQYCGPLASCFDELYRAMNSGTSRKGLPLSAVADLLMVTGMLPQHWMDQRPIWGSSSLTLTQCASSWPRSTLCLCHHSR